MEHTKKILVSFEIGRNLSEDIQDGVFTITDVWTILSECEKHLTLSPFVLIAPKGKSMSYVYNRLGGHIGIIKKTLKAPLWVKQMDYGTHKVRSAYSVKDWELKELEDDVL